MSYGKVKDTFWTGVTAGKCTPLGAFHSAGILLPLADGVNCVVRPFSIGECLA